MQSMSLWKQEKIHEAPQSLNWQEITIFIGERNF